MNVATKVRFAPERFPLNLVAVSLAATAVALGYGSMRHFYFQGAFLEGLSYVSDERPMAALVSSFMGVPSDSMLVGIHAFGDYLLPHYWVLLQSPWLSDQTGVLNYLPTALIPHKLLSFLPYFAGLGAFELMMAASLCAPALYALKGQPWALRVLAVVVLGLATGPSIASLDRANMQGFLPLVLFAFAVAVLRQRWGWATTFLVIAASIKIYPIMLVLVLLALRKWKWAAVSVASTIALALISLPLISGNVWPTARLVVTTVLEFGQRDFGSLMNYNVSLAGGLAHLCALLGADGGAQWIASHAIVVGAIYLVAVAPLLWFTAIELWIRLIVAFMLTTAVMPVVYPYAVNWVVAASALALMHSLGSRLGSPPGATLVPRAQWLPVLIALASLSACYPILIPHSMEAGTPVGLLAFVHAAVCVLLPLGLYAHALAERRQYGLKA
jgi:hypothetical protein